MNLMFVSAVHMVFAKPDEETFHELCIYGFQRQSFSLDTFEVFTDEQICMFNLCNDGLGNTTLEHQGGILSQPIRQGCYVWISTVGDVILFPFFHAYLLRVKNVVSLYSVGTF